MFKSVTLEVSLKPFKQTDKRFKTVHDEIYSDCLVGEKLPTISTFAEIL